VSELLSSLIAAGDRTPEQGNLSAGGIHWAKELGAVDVDRVRTNGLIVAGVVNKQATEEAVVTTGAGFLRGAAGGQGGSCGANR